MIRLQILKKIVLNSFQIKIVEKKSKKVLIHLLSQISKKLIKIGNFVKKKKFKKKSKLTLLISLNHFLKKNQFPLKILS